MAKEKALNILVQGTSTKDDLNEVLDGVLENIQVGAVSEALKNREGSGNPEAGSVIYKRFVNSKLLDKGTARAAGKGVAVEAKNIIVNIDTDKEIVEEFQDKDVKLYGVPALMAKRAVNQAKRIEAYLDREFFAEAVKAGTQFTRGSLTDIKAIIDAMIVKAKETSSDFIDGLEAEDLALVVNGSSRKVLKNELDALPNGTSPANGAIGTYDSVVTYESNRLPEGVTAIVMLKGAVAQPYYVNEYTAEKIQLDDAYAVSNFLYKGTKALIEEAIYYDKAEV